MDISSEMGEGDEGILGNVLCEGVGQGPGGVKIIDESLLSFLDGVGPVLGRDIGKAWKLGFRRKMTREHAAVMFENGH